MPALPHKLLLKGCCGMIKSCEGSKLRERSFWNCASSGNKSDPFYSCSVLKGRFLFDMEHSSED